MSKIEKTIARQQEKYDTGFRAESLNGGTDLLSRISEGQFYEAHQQLRVVASRYVKQENWTAAIDILYGGAQALLKAGQGGSGGDLCLYLVEVYNKAELVPDAESKGMLSYDANRAESVVKQQMFRLRSPADDGPQERSSHCLGPFRRENLRRRGLWVKQLVGPVALESMGMVTRNCITSPGRYTPKVRVGTEALGRSLLRNQNASPTTRKDILRWAPKTLPNSSRN